MNIFVAGGCGFETSVMGLLQSRIPDCTVTLAGGKWDLQAHAFPEVTLPGVEHYPHYFDYDTELDWYAYDLFIDLSHSYKSKYFLSQLAARDAKRCLALLPSSPYAWWDSGDSGHSLDRYLEYTYPPAPISTDALPESDIIQHLAALLESGHSSARSFDKQGVVCPLTPLNAGDERWIQKQLRDVCSEACGDRTVSLTPMEERRIILADHAQTISPYVTIKKISPFFIDFNVAGLDCMLFKQGRLMVSGTEAINDARFIYRWYVGS